MSVPEQLTRSPAVAHLIHGAAQCLPYPADEDDRLQGDPAVPRGTGARQGN